MGKRFGRNQKRRLKAQLERTEYQRDRLERDLSHARAIYREYRDTIDMTARVLGRHFVTLPPETVDIRSLQEIAGGWRAPKAGLVPAAFSSDVRASELRAALSIVEFHLLQPSSFMDEVVGMQHLTFELGGRKVAYGMTQQALDRLDDPSMVRRIGEEVAMMIATKGYEHE